MSAGRPLGEALELPLLLPRREPKVEVAFHPAEREPAAATDEALARELARGSAAAFEALLERYRDRVFQFVLWHLDSPPAAGRDLAEELTQEIFFQLYRSAASFRHRSGFRTWLYSLARNVCRHHRRKHRRELPAGGCEEAERAPAFTPSPPDPLERLAHAEDQARVRQAVATLPPQQRVVLVLRDWEELSYAEIAQVLEVPLGTVRSRLHHGRSTLAKLLGCSADGKDRHGL